MTLKPSPAWRDALTSPAAALLGVLLLIVCGSGASCPGFLNGYSAMPRVLPNEPTTADIISVVNTNSARIQSLYTTDAEIYVPGMPSARAKIALDRPRRLRVWADTMITGPEVDLGSNDELFWFWVRRASQPGVYYCRHDQFNNSVAHNFMPVEPVWLIEALGVATLDPAGDHSGPIPKGQGRLQITTRLPRPEGDYQRVMIVDAARGWVLEQHLYDARGTHIASAMQSGHHPDAIVGAIVPKQVKIIWPQTKFEMTIELNNVAVNQLGGDPQQLWTMPAIGSTPFVNLADPNLRLPTAGPTPAPQQPPAQPMYGDREAAEQTSRAPGGWLNRLVR